MFPPRFHCVCVGWLSSCLAVATVVGLDGCFPFHNRVVGTGHMMHDHVVPIKYRRSLHGPDDPELGAKHWSLLHRPHTPTTRSLSPTRSLRGCGVRVGGGGLERKHRLVPCSPWGWDGYPHPTTTTDPFLLSPFSLSPFSLSPMEDGSFEVVWCQGSSIEPPHPFWNILRSIRPRWDTTIAEWGRDDPSHTETTQKTEDGIHPPKNQTIRRDPHDEK